MRPFLVITVWVAIFGGLWAYLKFSDAWKRDATPETVIQPAPGEYLLEITPTYDLQGGSDPFGLTTASKPSIVAKLNGHEIVRHEEALPAGVPQTFQWDTQEFPVVTGDNEIHLALFTPVVLDDEQGARVVRGARVRLLRDGAQVAESMLWSSPGTDVAGIVRLTLDQSPDQHEHP